VTKTPPPESAETVAAGPTPSEQAAECLSLGTDAPTDVNSRGPRHWRSNELLGASGEAVVVHGNVSYRLRLTATGKLILTK
jgi:hemin uptake protein HemP